MKFRTMSVRENVIRVSFVTSLAAAAVLHAAPARGDWPMARHDARRTGASAGTSNLTTPVPYWRTYLGGATGPRGVIVADVDGDGAREIVYVGAGRAYASRPDATLVWQTPLLDLLRLDAVEDLDGDGVADVVLHSSRQVYVVSGRTGAVEWGEPLGEMGTIGDVRIADVNGDRLSEVIVQECGCCVVVSGNSGYAYSFASGFQNAERLWTLPAIQCAGYQSMTAVDADGDGKSELVLGTNTSLALLDGGTGSQIAVSPALGTLRVARSKCVPVDVDGVAGEELVCVLNEVVSTPGHSLFMLHYTATPAPTLSLVWQSDVGQVNGAIGVGPGFVSDLDGDGSLEVVVSGNATDETPSTYVFDAKTGDALGTLLGQKFVATANLEAPNRATILTTANAVLSAWDFQRGTSPLTYRWSLPDTGALVAPNWDLVRRSSISDAIVALDLTGDGLADLVTQDLTPGAHTIAAYSGAGGSASAAGTYTLPGNSDVLATWVVPPVNQPDDQILLAASDGLLTLHDSSLQSIPPGIRLTGYYGSGAWRALETAPVVARLGGVGDSVVAQDSRGALVRIDGATASMAVPPPASWARTHTTAPGIAAGLNGTEPGIICRAIREPVTDPPSYQIAALTADGTDVWRVPIENDPFLDLVPGKLDNDAIPDFMVQWGNPSDAVLHTRGISGATGATLWDSQVAPGPNRRPAGISSADWNGDGVDDLLFQFYATRVLSGADGVQIATNGINSPYFMPTLYDVDRDNKLEVILQGSFQAARTVDDDLSTVMWTGPDDGPLPYGAVSNCGSSLGFVEGTANFPARLRITQLDGTVGSSTTMVLAGGMMFADEASATTAGATLGQLASVSVHENLTGEGRPTAVVGSSDGWLYGVNACSGTLDFAYNFGFPVGAVAFGDTDGDGMDDMVVSVADGYVYDMRQPPIAAPSSVIDTDPPDGFPDVDVDEIQTLDTLFASWDAVTGADGYQVAVARADGTGFVTVPDWKDVGDVTTATLAGLSLEDGARYLVAVRAAKGTRYSPDTLSDGVVVHFPTDAGVDSGPDANTPDTGADAEADTGADAEADAGVDAAGVDAAQIGTVQGGGCNCEISQQRSGSGAWVGLILGATLWSFRRRRALQ